ncbi:MAG: fluoride efflux transporter CrcB [Saprospiraceae bacterium]
MGKIQEAILVFLGGGIGSVLRYAIAQWMQLRPLTFPAATLAANFLACLLLGFVLQAGFEMRTRLLLATGLCGGFSTFSTFTAENQSLWSSGRTDLMAFNVLANLLLCAAGLWIGGRLSA